MNTRQAEIEKALVDVRKAYRLLHQYQRTVLDAAKYISARLGVGYEGGYPCFSDCSPRPGRGHLDNWAWDWLNLIFYDFHFSAKNGHREINFLIRLFSDTGYFESRDPSAQTAFAAVETSRTVVAFFFYTKWKDELDNFINAKEEIKRFLESGQLPSPFKAAGVVGICRSFSCISDEESCDCIIDELLQLARTNGFPLKALTKDSRTKAPL